MNEFRNIMITLFKKKFLVAKKKPKIRAKKEEMNKASKLTLKDNITISNNVESKLIINFTEFKNISKIFIFNFFMIFRVAFYENKEK